MVYGIDKFREWFEEYNGKYAFIGGTACSIHFDNLGSEFRSTKDLDIVLILEAIDEAFVERFCKFIGEGQYEHKQKSTGKEQFYRFDKPKNKEFPMMIELFSKKPEYFYSGKNQN